VSRSAYDQRATGRRSARAVADERLVAVIRQVHAENFEAYGYRKLHVALRRRGIEVGRDRVKRLMRQHGIRGATRRGKPWQTTTPDPHAGQRPDLVCRDFTTTTPDRLYVADVTYLRCWEGLVCPGVRDRHARRHSRWRVSQSPARCSFAWRAAIVAAITHPQFLVSDSDSPRRRQLLRPRKRESGHAQRVTSRCGRTAYAVLGQTLGRPRRGRALEARPKRASAPGR
jgi:HTH-like domain